MPGPSTPPDLGVIVEVGTVRGRFAAVDPSGRYIAFARGGVVSVRDAHDALRETLSRVVVWSFLDVAVHPAGDRVAVLGEDMAVELHRSDGETFRFEGARRRTGSAGTAPDRSQPGWLRFTADGSFLLFGDAVGTGHVRLHLLDATTLTHGDTVTPLLNAAWGEPMRNWGEVMETAYAPAPSTAVAFASNVGDDPWVLGVAEVVRGRLQVRGATPGSPSLATDIPGETIHGLALPTPDDLVVLDSDDFVSSIRWRASPPTTRTLAYGGRWCESIAATLSGHGLVDEGGDEWVHLNGAPHPRGGLLAVPVERERWSPTRCHTQTVALGFLDLSTGVWLGYREVPGLHRQELIFVDGGVIRQRIGEWTRVARWRYPASPARRPPAAERA